jgi:HEAT repeat protein
VGNDPQEYGQGDLMGIAAKLFVRTAAAAFTAALFLSAILTCPAQTPSEIDRFAAPIASGTAEEKREALYQLRVIGTAEASRIALPALNDLSPTIRAEAAATCAYLLPDKAGSAISPLLRDKHAFVRKEAAIALGRARALNSVDALLLVLEKDKQKDVRAAAAAALGWIGDSAALPGLTRSFARNKGAKNAFLRREAAGAIGRIAESTRGVPVAGTIPESFLPLKYKNSSSEDRIDLSVSGSGFKQAAIVLASLLANSKEANEVRRNAAFALGAIGYAPAADAMRNCTFSDDLVLAETCREASAGLGIDD